MSTALAQYGTRRGRWPHRFGTLLLLGELVLVGWLFFTEDLAPLSGFLGVVAGVALLAGVLVSNWPLGPLLVLIGASAMPRFKWALGGQHPVHVRPEHVALVLVVALLMRRARRNFKEADSPWCSFDAWLVAYLAINFFTSAVTSPKPWLTLRMAALNAIVVLPYFLVRWLVTDQKAIVSAFRVLATAGVVEAAYGSFCFLSHQLFETNFGVELEQYGEIPGTYGTQYEANLFGAYTACAALMCLAGFLFDEKKHWRWYLCGFLIATLGMFIGLARAVILAFPIAAVFLIWLATKKGRLHLRGLTTLLALVVTALLFVSPVIVRQVRERFSTIDTSDLGTDESTIKRLIQISFAIDDVRKHPWLGTGTSSFQLFFDWNDYFPEDPDEPEPERGAWVGNTPVRILHDTGIVGLAVFTGFCLALLQAVRRACKTAPGLLWAVMVGLVPGLILWAITFQATDGTMLSFTWIHVGLLAAAVTVVLKRRGGSADEVSARA